MLTKEQLQARIRLNIEALELALADLSAAQKWVQKLQKAIHGYRAELAKLEQRPARGVDNG